MHNISVDYKLLYRPPSRMYGVHEAVNSTSFAFAIPTDLHRKSELRMIDTN